MAKMKTDKQVESTLGLLKVARYLSRPQQFVAVADARAELKRTLERAEKSSVVLTSNGEPAAALVPFSTLESIRDALMQLLVNELEDSFSRAQLKVTEESPGEPVSEEELESLTRDAVRKARRQARKTQDNAGIRKAS